MPKISITYMITLLPGTRLQFIQFNDSLIDSDELPKARRNVIIGVAKVNVSDSFFSFKIKTLPAGENGGASFNFTYNGRKLLAADKQLTKLRNGALSFSGEINVSAPPSVGSINFRTRKTPARGGAGSAGHGRGGGAKDNMHGGFGKSRGRTHGGAGSSGGGVHRREAHPPRPVAKKAAPKKAAAKKAAPKKAAPKKAMPAKKAAPKKNILSIEAPIERVLFEPISNKIETLPIEEINAPDLGIIVSGHPHPPLGQIVKKKPAKGALANPLKDPGGTVRVFYGTNRNKTNYQKVNKKYGNQIGDMSYGFCDISIPTGHTLGRVERPEGWRAFRWTEDAQKDIVIEHLEEVGQQALVAAIKQAMANTKRKAALIFVHGYRVSFAEAAWQTGQIAWDTEFKGITGFFSWPSSGKYISYLADQRRARASVADLADYIQMLANNNGIEEFHFIAHSMGTLVLTSALNILAALPVFNSKMAAIKQVVLGAPDIDQQEFERVILPAFRMIGSSRTIYSSQLDLALGLSDDLFWRKPRLGSAGADLFVTKDIDTVDASNIDIGGANHSYIFESERLLMDLLLLFNQGLPPMARHLLEARKAKLPYWLFRQSQH